MTARTCEWFKTTMPLVVLDAIQATAIALGREADDWTCTPMRLDAAEGGNVSWYLASGEIAIDWTAVHPKTDRAIMFIDVNDGASDELIGTLREIAASTGIECEHCYPSPGLPASTIPLKRPSWLGRLDRWMRSYRHHQHPFIVALAEWRVRLWLRVAGQRCMRDAKRCPDGGCVFDCERHL